MIPGARSVISESFSSQSGPAGGSGSAAPGDHRRSFHSLSPVGSLTESFGAAPWAQNPCLLDLDPDTHLDAGAALLDFDEYDIVSTIMKDRLQLAVCSKQQF